MSRYPRFYVPYVRRRIAFREQENVLGGVQNHIKIQSQLIYKNTEIVIEGFQRSGNTFAYVAFILPQLRPVNVAHRVHAPAQVIAGIRMNIPVILLIRDSRDAALSFTIHTPYLTPRQALSSFVGFITFSLHAT